MLQRTSGLRSGQILQRTSGPLILGALEIFFFASIAFLAGPLSVDRFTLQHDISYFSFQQNLLIQERSPFSCLFDNRRTFRTRGVGFFFLGAGPYETVERCFVPQVQQTRLICDKAIRFRSIAI